MKNEFKYTKTTVSLINYHFVFCPRYRRKIFNIPGVETAFKTMVMDICKETIKQNGKRERKMKKGKGKQLNKKKRKNKKNKKKKKKKKTK